MDGPPLSQFPPCGEERKGDVAAGAKGNERPVMRSSIRIQRPTVLVDSLLGNHRPLFRQCRVHSSRETDHGTRNRPLTVKETKLNCLMVEEPSVSNVGLTGNSFETADRIEQRLQAKRGRRPAAQAT